MRALGSKIVIIAKTCALLSTHHTYDINTLQKTLGGVIKIGTIVAKTTETHLAAAMEGYIQTMRISNRKIYFGISAYPPLLDLKKLALELKKRFKQSGWRSRWVQSQRQTLSSVVVKTNKLLSSRGVEFVIVSHQNALWLGVTQTVQPFDEYSWRDYGRPYRDIVSGMLPPKVAQMMINLAGIPKEAPLLDPFCGSGTILQEALVLGYKHVVGTDISRKAVNQTVSNIAWLRTKKPTDAPSPSIFVSSISALTAKLPAHSIRAIVTEPYLGPPQKGSESEAEIKKNCRQLSKLYKESFQTFTTLLAREGAVVIVMPIIHNQRLPILEEIYSLGFSPEKKFKDIYDDTMRKSFLYGRQGQKIWREIFVFTLQGR